MPIEVLMPALSPTMTEGNLAKWYKKEGDAVSAGDLLAEIETDKATMEVEAVDEGVLGRILVADGTEGVAVNTPIALLLAEGEDAADLDSTTPSGPAEPAAPAPAETPPAAPTAAGSTAGVDGGASAASPLARRMAVQAGLDLAAIPGSGPRGRTVKRDIEAAASGISAATEKGDGRIFASPLARKMAAQAGLDLAAIGGSGPGGRIVKSDIDAALAGGAPSAPPAAPSLEAASTTADDALTLAVEAHGMPAYTEAPHSTMRKVIARRLVESKREAPHFYLTIDCRLDELLKVRKQLNARSPESEGAYKISINDFVIRAVALALIKVPAANASWTDTAIRRYHSADISVAVAVPDGLITPVVRGAEGKGLAVISNEMKDLAVRAREGKLMPEEYQGGSFSISNLGMFGVREFAAVINPPQGCILAVGAGEQRAVVSDGALAVATVMSCTLSIDHRVVDGAVGAEFLAAFKKLIEDPLSMLL